MNIDIASVGKRSKGRHLTYTFLRTKFLRKTMINLGLCFLSENRRKLSKTLTKIVF